MSFFGVASAYLGFSGGIGGSVGITVDNADPPPGDGSGKVRYSEIQTELQDGQERLQRLREQQCDGLADSLRLGQPRPLAL